VAILVPASLLLLSLLNGFTLLSYRGAVERMVEQRQGEALEAARRMAAELAAGGTAGSAELARLRAGMPSLLSLVLVDDGGRPVAASGDLPVEEPLDPFDGAVDTAVAVGPGEAVPGRVAAAVPLVLAGRRHVLRVDMDAAVLAGQRRGMPLLTAVVLVVTGGVALLLVLFVRHLMAPYDLLLARARDAGGSAGPGVEGEDEIAFLLHTFERGLAALARGGEGDDDLAALERTLAASLESGLLLLDRQGRVVAINPTGSELLDVDAPRPRLPLAAVLVRHPALVELLTRTVEERAPLRRQELTLAVGGRKVDLGLTAHLLRSGGDASEVSGFLVLFADLTEARRHAEEARLADDLRRLGEMAAGVAHELRNSLATLRGYLTLLERAAAGEPPGAYLDEVRHEADHLLRVVEDFLAFARPGRARVAAVDLGTVVARAAADPALAGEVAVTADPKTPPLAGDARLLEQAVRNQLRNAVEAEQDAAAAEAGRRPAAVEVTVGPGGEDGIEIVVADRGTGVAPEIADRLFQPFATGRAGGVGLGLALAHRIVTLHGGTLRLEPRAGGGTRAVMRFSVGNSVTEGNESQVLALGPESPYLG
jgi:signal transduction histidine kinase